jgi:hypothetical protein
MQFLDIALRRAGAGSVALVQRYVRAGMAARRISTAMPREGVRRSRRHRAMFDQLGPAVNSGKSLFLYGAPGNGKTGRRRRHRPRAGQRHVRAARHRRRRPDHHHVRPGQPPVDRVGRRSQSVVAASAQDRRWEQIRRPVVVVGGELTLDMLDLTFNPIAKFYEAPIQMKANGGVFVVDDFGRQRIPPRDLLNRWIVPLESRVDFLTLHTGRKFEIPFNVFIIFATNLKPESLADEAFLRRIPYKIRRRTRRRRVLRIFELNCRKRGCRSTGDGRVPDRKYYQPRKLQMRACHPRDLVEQVVNICRYQGRELTITRELLDQACGSYFLEETESQGAGA